MERYDEKRRKLAFRRAFDGTDGAIVLDYLSSFCHEFEDLFLESERKSCYAAGMRSVMLEVRRNLREEKDDVSY